MPAELTYDGAEDLGPEEEWTDRMDPDPPTDELPPVQSEPPEGEPPRAGA